MITLDAEREAKLATEEGARAGIADLASAPIVRPRFLPSTPARILVTQRTTSNAKSPRTGFGIEPLHRPEAYFCVNE